MIYIKSNKIEKLGYTRISFMNLVFFQIYMIFLSMENAVVCLRPIKGVMSVLKTQRSENQ